MNRDFVYGVLAGLGISSLGGGLYWLVKKMKKVRLEVIWSHSAHTFFLYRSPPIPTKQRKSIICTWRSIIRQKKSIWHIQRDLGQLSTSHEGVPNSASSTSRYIPTLHREYQLH